MIGCCENITKFLMFFFNLLVALCGVAILIVGAIFLNKAHMQVVGTTTDVIAIILIAVGAAVFLIAFFGFCGAITENACMLLIFIILLTILVIIEISIGVVAVVYENKVREYLNVELMHSFNNYGKEQTNTLFWDQVQINYKCCGIRSYGDYETIAIPPSCCQHLDQNWDCSVLNCSKVGCGHKLVDLYKLILGVLAGTAIGIGCIQITGIIFSCYLYSKFK